MPSGPWGKVRSQSHPIAAGPTMCASACGIGSALGILNLTIHGRERPIIAAVCHNASPLEGNGRKKQRSETIARAAFSSMATVPSRQELAPDWWQATAPLRRRREPAQTTFLQTAHSIPPDGQAHIAPMLGMHQRNTRPSQALLIWGRRRVGIFVQFAHGRIRLRRSGDGALEAPAQDSTAQHSTGRDGGSGNGKFHWATRLSTLSRKTSFARRDGGLSRELAGAVSSGDAARFGAPGQPLSHLACSIDGVRHHPGNGRIHLVAAQRSVLSICFLTPAPGWRPEEGSSGRWVLMLFFSRRSSYFTCRMKAPATLE